MEERKYFFWQVNVCWRAVGVISLRDFSASLRLENLPVER